MKNNSSSFSFFFDKNNKFYWKLDIWLITLLSHPQIAYELIEAGGAKDILQVQGLAKDGLNNSKDTIIQYIQ